MHSDVFRGYRKGTLDWNGLISDLLRRLTTGMFGKQQKFRIDQCLPKLFLETTTNFNTHKTKNLTFTKKKLK